MKKLTFCLITTFMLLSFIPVQLKATEEIKTVSAVTAKTPEATDAVQQARLGEINAMDMSTLTRSEKKALRSEVKAIKSDQDGRGRRYNNGHDRMDGRRHGGSLYIMGGSGLLIIVLIIILL